MRWLAALLLLTTWFAACGEKPVPPETGKAPATPVTKEGEDTGGPTRFGVPGHEDEIFVEVTPLDLPESTATDGPPSVQVKARLCRPDGTAAGQWWDGKPGGVLGPEWSGRLEIGGVGGVTARFVNIKPKPGVHAPFDAVFADLHADRDTMGRVTLHADLRVFLCIR